MRTYKINSWNWSERAKKWVYVKLSKGKRRKYSYQVEPPPIFVELNSKLSNLNKRLMEITDPVQNQKVFDKLIEVTKKMQNMGFQ